MDEILNHIHERKGYIRQRLAITYLGTRIEMEMNIPDFMSLTKPTVRNEEAYKYLSDILVMCEELHQELLMPILRSARELADTMTRESIGDVEVCLTVSKMQVKESNHKFVRN